MIKFFISGIIILLGFYYLTVFVHLMGIQIFHVKEISIGKALIPFYYWFKREVVK